MGCVPGRREMDLYLGISPNPFPWARSGNDDVRAAGRLLAGPSELKPITVRSGWYNSYPDWVGTNVSAVGVDLMPFS